jgi:hypothetical protein
MDATIITRVFFFFFFFGIVFILLIACMPNSISII